MPQSISYSSLGPDIEVDQPVSKHVPDGEEKHIPEWDMAYSLAHGLLLLLGARVHHQFSEGNSG